IDTSKPEVMCGAVSAGADIINDVAALQLPGALEAAAEMGVPVCLMHMQGRPATMQENPHYDNVMREIIEFLNQRIEMCCAAGLSHDQIVVDPGFGFGKNLSHNLQLLRNLDKFSVLRAPLMVGISRKGMIGQILGARLDQRLPGSLACAVIAAQRGAHIIRVHDVRATVDAIKIVNAVEHNDENRVDAL
ncbi:MAG: dihydropteroate synthase, partial [Pseudomonadota bacterium]